MRKAFWLIVSALIGCFYACSENTGSMGMESIPEADGVTLEAKTFGVSARTLAVDSVLARTQYCYLGNYTDEETGTNVHADFLMQFNLVEGFKLSDAIKGDSSTRIEVKLFFDEFVGDSLAPCRVSLYPLTKSLDNNKQPYTNLNPTEYYNEAAGPLVTKTFTLMDRQISDSLASSDSYYQHINFVLPKQVGDDILKKYKEHPEYFANSKTFHEHVNRGYYVKFERGEGVMANIYVSQMNVSYKYYTDSRVGKKDSLVSSSVSFAATQEVVQANKLTHSNMSSFVNDSKYAYLKTPSSLWTELTLPSEEISHYTDTINSARLILNCYNSTLNDNYLQAPAYILMVRKDSLNTFFENYQVPNNETSYLASYDTSDIKNTYQFNNISTLLTVMRNEYWKGTDKDPDWLRKHPNWNKVVLVPVTPTLNSSGSVSMVDHDLSLRYVRLKNDEINLNIIFSRFNK